MAASIRYEFSHGLDDLKWLNAPQKFICPANEKGGLKVFMDKETDFWQKTYYNPPLLNDNGHVLYRDIGSNMLMETTFHLNNENQFDQAGLMVYRDKDTWIKTGIEAVDGAHRLSVVVTNTYSDWSTQMHAAAGNLALRVYRFKNDFVIEAKSESLGDWQFIRICHLSIGESEPIKAGLYAANPLAKAGASVVFDYLQYSECKEYHHKAT